MVFFWHQSSWEPPFPEDFDRMGIYKEDMNTSKGVGRGVLGWGPNYQFINYFPHLLPDEGLPNFHTHNPGVQVFHQ